MLRRCKMRGATDDAIAQYQEIVAIDPNDAHAWFELGHLQYKQGQLDDAVASFEKSLALKPDPPDVDFNLALAYHDQGKLPDGHRAV